jgi:hypothetical protein
MPKLNEVGRNDPCPCGSGKKYKKCCMNNSKPAVVNNSTPTPMSNVFELYNKMTSEFDGMTNERTENEIAYDNIILDALRNGKPIKEALDIAAKKYPEEALQYNDENIDDIHSHYDYLLNHDDIKNRMGQISN